jgi:ankyrin repeat protein
MNRHQIAASASAVAVLVVCSTAFIRGAGSDVADAVMKGDQAAIKKLLTAKADVNAPQVDGATALHWAVYRDDLETASQLIRAGANVTTPNREGTTPLFMASLYGNPKMIELLIKAGADAKALGPNGETTVMFAARNGNPEAIKALVAAGADVNAAEKMRGTTALMWATTERHPGAVKALIELGADYSAKSGPAGLPRNRTVGPINGNAVALAGQRRRAAAAAGRTIEEQIQFEQFNGTFVGAGDGFGAGQPDAAPAAAARGRGAAAARGTPGAAGRGAAAGGAAAGRGAAPRAAAPAADNGADQADDIVAGLVGGGSGGLTPLVFAARENDIESAKILLDAGADVNQTTEYGWTPLLTAVNNRNYKLAALLLERGANPKLANKGGWTPLYLATDNRNIEGGDYPVPKADMDHMDMIKLLLAKGADVVARVKENTLQRTIFTNQWFLEAGATPFIRASQSSDLELMKVLLAAGADPKATTDHKDTALTVSAGIGWVDGVVYERSPKDNIEAVRLLLDLGVDPNAANNDGRTALMGAAHKGRNEVVQMLVDRGARLDVRDKGSRDTGNPASKIAGRTWQPLDYADGLVRFGVQSAVEHRETAALIRRLMTDRGLPVPPANRTVDSICVVEVC